MNVEFDHVHVRVKNVAKAMEALSPLLGPDFYTWATGSKVLDLSEKGIKVARNGVMLMMEVTDPGRLPGEAATGAEEGIVHLSFRVSDMDEAIAGLKSRGARIVRESAMGQLRETLVEFPGIPWALFELVAFQAANSSAAAEG